jgi:hypothetical protein
VPTARTIRTGIASAIALAGIGVGTVVGVTPAAAAVRTAHHTAAVSRLAQRGHGPFGQCPARTTTLLIAVNRLELHPGQTLTVDFIATNEGTSACSYTGPAAATLPGSATASLSAGPCGSIGFAIEGAHHRNVWPGRGIYSCPALGLAHLQPGASAAGSGQWDQTMASGQSRVRPGTYTLVVDRRFSFRLHVEAH